METSVSKIGIDDNLGEDGAVELVDQELSGEDPSDEGLSDVELVDQGLPDIELPKDALSKEELEVLVDEFAKEEDGEDEDEDGDKVAPKIKEPTYMKPRTIGVTQLSRTHKYTVADLGGSLKEQADWAEANRPQVRAHCVDGPRPCPFMLCRYHLYLEVLKTGALRINFPDKDPMEMPYSCALDIAERGGIVLEELGLLMRITRERMRQIEAYAKLRISETLKDPDRKGGGEYLSTWSESEEKDNLRAVTAGIREDTGHKEEGLSLEEAEELGLSLAFFEGGREKENDSDLGSDLDLDFSL